MNAAQQSMGEEVGAELKAKTSTQRTSNTADGTSIQTRFRHLVNAICHYLPGFTMEWEKMTDRFIELSCRTGIV
ncbi:hypothetical protein ROBYS_00580 [Roseobacter sp. OBYS 0001]|nr:hypothetical protein ROBYS_00580 [Roseobacter sp. OBYS 0001]